MNTVAVGARHEGLRPRCWSARCSATPTRRAISAARAADTRCASRSAPSTRATATDPWYVGATLGRRQPRLLGHHSRHSARARCCRTESSDARGYEFTGRILGGYWFTMRDFMHGPYARLAVHEGPSSSSFPRKSLDSTALTYDRQSRNAAVVEPRMAGRRTTSALFVPMRGRHGRSTRSDPDKTHQRARRPRWAATIAVPDRSSRTTATRSSASAPATELGGVTGFIAGSATAAARDGNYWAITVGLRMPLVAQLAPQRAARSRARSSGLPRLRGARANSAS